LKVLTLTPRKPIIYLPGMISLVLLPVACLIFLNMHGPSAGLNRMDIVLWSPDMVKLFPEDYRYYPTHRKYVNITLDGDDEQNKARLVFARSEVTGILQAKDTVRGVNIHFTDKSKYWAYVNAWDICLSQGIQNYRAYNNDFSIIYGRFRKIHTTPAPMIITPINIDSGMDYYSAEYIWKQKKKAFALALKIFWAPFIVFLLMTFFALKKLRLNLKGYEKN
jgi:hypothetical protein